MANCSADGRILQSTLVGPVQWETNDSTAVRILCPRLTFDKERRERGYMLILCFSLKDGRCQGSFKSSTGGALMPGHLQLLLALPQVALAMAFALA